MSDHVEQGKALHQEPLFSLTPLELTSPPLVSHLKSFPKTSSSSILSNIKILDMTRVIAGPVITRTLAEYGADILKVTPLHVPDTTYFQMDLNFGKRTVDLDLKSAAGRATFEKLLEEVDVIVDGYRPGVMEKLGYGPEELVKRFKESGRVKGFVYMQENCYGWEGEWSGRPGWQQIADSVSGFSWEHGRSLGLDEPVGLPFPITDFG